MITKFDGKPITHAIDLRRIAGATRPGTRVDVQIYRRGVYKDVSVVLATMSDDAATTGKPSKDDKASPAPASLGLSVEEIDPEQKRALKLHGGVRVTAVDGEAAEVGLREGDLILSVNNVEVANVAQFSAQMAKLAKAKVVSMVVRREDISTIVLLHPAAH